MTKPLRTTVVFLDRSIEYTLLHEVGYLGNPGRNRPEVESNGLDEVL